MCWLACLPLSVSRPSAQASTSGFRSNLRAVARNRSSPWSARQVEEHLVHAAVLARDIEPHMRASWPAGSGSSRPKTQ